MVTINEDMSSTAYPSPCGDHRDQRSTIIYRADGPVGKKLASDVNMDSSVSLLARGSCCTAFFCIALVVSHRHSTNSITVSIPCSCMSGQPCTGDKAVRPRRLRLPMEYVQFCSAFNFLMPEDWSSKLKASRMGRPVTRTSITLRRHMQPPLTSSRLMGVISACEIMTHK